MAQGDVPQEEKAEKFDILKVETTFSDALVDEDDVSLKLFVAAYEELNKFIGMLGTIFQFVQADVNSKTSTLRSLLVACPEDYGTVKNMIVSELASNRQRGTKSLLALHRALQFIEFMSELAASTNESSVSELCRRSYDKTLAKHHNWAVRQAVALASYTLPNRKTLIVSIVDYEPEESYIKEVIMRVVAKSRDVYNRVHGYFDQHALHHLI